MSSSFPRKRDTKVATLSAPPTGTMVMSFFSPALPLAVENQ